MKSTQILYRWLPTFIAFPLGGLIVSIFLGPVGDLVSASISGAIVGAVLGFSQWWALKPFGVGIEWAWSSAVSLMLASPIAWATISFSTSILSLTLWGLIAGILFGLGQVLSQKLGAGKSTAWAFLVGSVWALAWLISANVIVDADSSYAIFGSTGAIVATAILGLFLNPIFNRK